MQVLGGYAQWRGTCMLPNRKFVHDIEHLQLYNVALLLITAMLSLNDVFLIQQDNCCNTPPVGCNESLKCFHALANLCLRFVPVPWSLHDL